MTINAADTAFAVVFTLFIVAVVVLLVLVVRFIFQRASISRSSWLARQEGAGSDDDGDEEEEESRRGPITALVLAGGGTRGAVQIGMLQVLTERGFVPDRIYGTSVGAMNGVAFASDPTRQGVERMTEIWSGLTRATPCTPRAGSTGRGSTSDNVTPSTPTTVCARWWRTGSGSSDSKKR